MITITVPGKIHFLGEHTAVYGKPALLAALGTYCTVTITPLDKKVIQITLKNFNQTITVSVQEILKRTESAQKQWETYRENNEISVLQSIIKQDWDYPVIAIGETLNFIEKSPQQGFHVTIDSAISIGSGLGSSAAVAVSIVAGVSKFLGCNLQKEEIGKIAIRIEQKKHGNPSYGDVAAVINGGFIWFRKETPDVVIVHPLSLSFPQIFSDKLMIVQTGIPIESTGEMVHLAAKFKKQYPKIFYSLLEDQERLTRDLFSAIKNADEDAFLQIIHNGEKNLERLGVVSMQTRKVIRKIEQSGGAAKICGAGGRKEGSGIVLAYHQDRSKLEKLIESQNLSFEKITLGVAGLKLT